MGGVAELEPLQQVAGALLPVVEPAQPRGELEVLPRRGPRHQPADVGAVADQPLDGERVGADVVAGHPDLARGRRDHAGEDAHGRRLAGAVAAEERRRLAGVALEVDAGDGLDLAEAHVQPADVDDGLAVGGAHPRILPKTRGHVAGFGKGGLPVRAQAGKDSPFLAISRSRSVGRNRSPYRSASSSARATNAARPTGASGSAGSW